MTKTFFIDKSSNEWYIHNITNPEDLL